MIRGLSIIVLGVVSVVATPLDAQLFRRAARARNQAARQAQVNQARPNNRNQEIQQPRQDNSQQRNQTRTRQPTASFSGTRPQLQRFAVFYNRLTNQTILRPIQTTPNPNSRLQQNPVPQRSNSQARQSAPAMNTQRSQVDIARQSDPAMQTSGGNLSLSAPSKNPRPAVKSTPTNRVGPSPAGSEPRTLTRLPNGKKAVESAAAKKAQPASVPPNQAETPKRTFSILETDDK